MLCCLIYSHLAVTIMLKNHLTRALRQTMISSIILVVISLINLKPCNGLLTSPYLNSKNHSELPSDMQSAEIVYFTTSSTWFLVNLMYNHTCPLTEVAEPSCSSFRHSRIINRWNSSLMSTLSCSMESFRPCRSEPLLMPAFLKWEE